MLNHILIIDDDQQIRELLKKYLLKNNLAINTSSNTAEAKKYMEKYNFDLLIVDNMMPNENGIDFIKSLRKKNNYIPTIMLTALGEMEHKLEGLSNGADDYITKPFDPQELLLRIKNILNRIKGTWAVIDKNSFVFGDFVFYLDKNELYKNGVLIDLTNVETKLLNIFLKNVNETISREKINIFLGGELNTNSINVLITRLRKKIETNNKKLIKTIRNKGYLFSV